MEVEKVSKEYSGLKPLKESLIGRLLENYYRIDLSSGQQFYAAVAIQAGAAVQAVMIPVLGRKNSISTDLGNPTVIDVQRVETGIVVGTVGIKKADARRMFASLLSVSFVGTFRQQAAREFEGVDKQELSAAMDEMARLDRCLAQQRLNRRGLEPQRTR